MVLDVPGKRLIMWEIKRVSYNPIEQSFNQIKQWMRKNRDKLQHYDSFEDFF
jgi:hypothetical protein